MSGAFFSSSWYRVAHLVPGLRDHVRFHRHRYRGRIWFVLEDRASRRNHRLTPAAHLLAGLMDGRRTVQQIWEIAGERLEDDAPTQDEVIRLLGLLHLADAIRCDVTPDTAELLRRCQRRERADGWQRLANPLSVKVSFGDPDPWLARITPVVSRVWHWPAAVLGVLVVLAGAFVAVQHAPELGADAAARLLSPHNLLLLLVVVPVMKALHELGHAITTRVYGGEVRDVGVLFLVLMPVPYVDASAAGAWPEKSRRIAVGAAGIVVECVLAAVGVLVWAAVEPGLVRTVAFDVAWLGVASSLLVNGNPLLRFDGYYVLSDAIEIPNLRQRASQYLQWLVLDRVFHAPGVRHPVQAPGEAPWLAAFGVASFAYRLFILLAIALFLSERFFVLGMALAVFAVATQCVLPLVAGIRFLVSSPRLGDRRGRAIGITGTVAALVLLGTLVIPLPYHTQADGVVWPPDGAQVRARADGFVVEVLAASGERVRRGQPLVRTRDPVLETRLEVEQARLRALEVRQHAELVRDRVQARIAEDRLVAARAAVARARERVGQVMVRSPGDGRFVVPAAADWGGRFVRHGELLGYVVADRTTTARVALPQSEAARIRETLEGIEVRTVAGPARVWPAELLREVPGASVQLPSAALGTAGGGRIPVDPGDPSGRTPLESIFQLDLSLPDRAAAGGIGARVHVRFDHGAEPVGFRMLRAVQRLLLGRAIGW